MFKSAGLLLVLGLAIGLWLGFNPQAHRQTVQMWNEARAAYLNIQAQTSAKLNGWAVRLNSKTQTTSNTTPKLINVAWQELASIFSSIWNSLHKLWLSISASLGLHNQGLQSKK